MSRKKWTPKEEVTDSDLRFREKRKWQLALRRYVLEKNKSSAYAYYFGLGIDGFREWIGIQFTEGLNWENFGAAWQFDHIVPVACFDFDIEEDLVLCWNFINIRVERIESNKAPGNCIGVMAARPYFEALYKNTGNAFCLKMLDKISRIESLNMNSDPATEGFIIRNKTQLERISTLNKEEFSLLNTGKTINDIFLEREIIKKFG